MTALNGSADTFFSLCAADTKSLSFHTECLLLVCDGGDGTHGLGVLF